MEDEQKLAEQARFWQKVNLCRSDAGNKYCWEWRGSTDEKGYGLFRLSTGVLLRAHRFSFQCFLAKNIADILVCHHCDNPRCVRPSHLFSGTHVENVADRERKGRGVRLTGEAHGRSKLNFEKVRAIKIESSLRRITQRSLATKYGVSQHTIWNVLNNRTWNAS